MPHPRGLAGLPEKLARLRAVGAEIRDANAGASPDRVDDDDSVTVSLAPVPGPGETCHHCHRPMPATALEVWLDQQGLSFDGLAEQVTDHQIVAAWFRVRSRPRPDRISKNMVWRLNHQAPWWRGPSPSTPGFPVQAALLEITGLEVADLQNRKPHTDGYACDARKREGRLGG